jgi:ERF superfamily
LKTSESTKEIYAAFIAANEELTNPSKSQTVAAGRRSYSFAPLPEIVTTTREILRKHGLALIQEAKADEGYAGVGTRLIHTSGEWIEYDPLFLPTALDAQSYGSAITYARRYAWTAALGIAADEDDDAQKATARKKSQDSAARTHSRTEAETWPEAVAAADSVAAESGSSQPDLSDILEDTTLEKIVEKFGVNKALAAARRMGFKVTSLGQLTEDEAQKMLDGEIAP